MFSILSIEFFIVTRNNFGVYYDKLEKSSYEHMSGNESLLRYGPFCIVAYYRQLFKNTKKNMLHVVGGSPGDVGEVPMT